MLALRLRDLSTKDPRRVATTAAISSSLGNECCLTGATRDFDITNEEWLPHWMQTTAPYAFGLASAKICRVTAEGLAVAVKECTGVGRIVVRQ